ncbi:MAG: DUF5320 domain-containing protein [Desulfobacteraceae bacterium]|nr:DUF5320 domain-containing protein [Desulfobacteraceae bacterium]
MPGFNGTGPMGAGPMTGGGRGFCNPANAGYERSAVGTAGFGGGMAYGRGFRGGFGRGVGRGFGRGFALNQPPYFNAYPQDAASELDMLKVQADSAKNMLDSINKRLTELERSSE